MPRKKIYERKISLNSHRIKLYETTDSYIKGQIKTTGKTAPQIIREMCEHARLEKLTHGQFSAGTTKTFQSVTNKLLKKNLDDPLAEIGEKLERLEVKIQEMDLNLRFSDEEAFRVMRLFFVENQLLSELLHKLLESHRIEVNVAEERQAMKANYQTNYNTRRDAFFTKYERLFMEKLVRDTAEAGADGSEEGAESDEKSEVIDASQTDQSN